MRCKSALGNCQDADPLVPGSGLRLAGLHRLLLRFVLLRQLLRLLGMLLFGLLRLGRTGIRLMLRVLLLLQLLPVLGLLSYQFVLLLLVFLVGLGIP